MNQDDPARRARSRVRELGPRSNSRTRDREAARTWTLLGPDGAPFASQRPGTFGGHRRSKRYGRLDCPAAARALARGGPYATHRVFFADEAAARAAGFRPCAVCLPAAYAAWRAEG